MSKRSKIVHKAKTYDCYQDRGYLGLQRHCKAEVRERVDQEDISFLRTPDIA